jgi:diadenosine tetraphosphate (Ap4A) HIT family hydrolase
LHSPGARAESWLTQFSIVLGDINGHLDETFKKLTSLHAKQNFAFAIIAGNLFADPADATPQDEANVQSLINGQIQVPFQTYFALGKHALPQAVVEKMQTSDDELCTNLHFLGKRNTLKTSEGIRIVTLGGRLDPNIIAGQSKDQYLPFYTDTDAKVLRGAQACDILITGEWPEGVLARSKVALKGDVQPSAQQCVADLNIALKPRYHISTSTAFYEREPFFHEPSEDTGNLYPITRFLSLASYGNPAKEKWLYAFNLDPTASHPVTIPQNSTACPMTHSITKKRPAQDQGQALVYDDGRRSRNGHKKRKGTHHRPLNESDCVFCLANENVSTHLVTSIGETSYVTVAKGPLSESQTFPELGFPCHMLIIPTAHQPTLAAIDEEERTATYTEMQKFRTSMNKMLKAKTGEKYGSVTWEVSKSSLMHTHWQYLPVPAESIRKGLLQAAFKVLAENLKWPPFANDDVGDGFDETSDFFRVMIWDPKDPEEKQTSLTMRINEEIRFHVQFGREVMAKLLRLDDRVDWRNCGQMPADEEKDVAVFKEAFQAFDFT